MLLYRLLLAIILCLGNITNVCSYCSSEELKSFCSSRANGLFANFGSSPLCYFYFLEDATVTSLSDLDVKCRSLVANNANYGRVATFPTTEHYRYVVGWLQNLTCFSVIIGAMSNHSSAPWLANYTWADRGSSGSVIATKAVFPVFQASSDRPYALLVNTWRPDIFISCDFTSLKFWPYLCEFGCGADPASATYRAWDSKTIKDVYPAVNGTCQATSTSSTRTTTTDTATSSAVASASSGKKRSIATTVTSTSAPTAKTSTSAPTTTSTSAPTTTTSTSAPTTTTSTSAPTTTSTSAPTITTSTSQPTTTSTSAPTTTTNRNEPTTTTNRNEPTTTTNRNEPTTTTNRNEQTTTTSASALRTSTIAAISTSTQSSKTTVATIGTTAHSTTSISETTASRSTAMAATSASSYTSTTMRTTAAVTITSPLLTQSSTIIPAIASSASASSSTTISATTKSNQTANVVSSSVTGKATSINLLETSTSESASVQTISPFSNTASSAQSTTGTVPPSSSTGATSIAMIAETSTGTVTDSALRSTSQSTQTSTKVSTIASTGEVTITTTPTTVRTVPTTTPRTESRAITDASSSTWKLSNAATTATETSTTNGDTAMSTSGAAAQIITGLSTAKSTMTATDAAKRDRSTVEITSNASPDITTAGAPTDATTAATAIASISVADVAVTEASIPPVGTAASGTSTQITAASMGTGITPVLPSKPDTSASAYGETAFSTSAIDTSAIQAAIQSATSPVIDTTGSITTDKNHTPVTVTLTPECAESMSTSTASSVIIKTTTASMETTIAQSFWATGTTATSTVATSATNRPAFTGAAFGTTEASITSHFVSSTQSTTVPPLAINTAIPTAFTIAAGITGQADTDAVIFSSAISSDPASTMSTSMQSITAAAASVTITSTGTASDTSSADDKTEAGTASVPSVMSAGPDNAASTEEAVTTSSEGAGTEVAPFSTMNKLATTDADVITAEIRSARTSFEIIDGNSAETGRTSSTVVTRATTTAQTAAVNSVQTRTPIVTNTAGIDIATTPARTTDGGGSSANSGTTLLTSSTRVLSFTASPDAVSNNHAVSSAGINDSTTSSASGTSDGDHSDISITTPTSTINTTVPLTTTPIILSSHSSSSSVTTSKLTSKSTSTSYSKSNSPFTITETSTVSTLTNIVPTGMAYRSATTAGESGSPNLQTTSPTSDIAPSATAATLPLPTKLTKRFNSALFKSIILNLKCPVDTTAATNANSSPGATIAPSNSPHTAAPNPAATVVTATPSSVAVPGTATQMVMAPHDDATPLYSLTASEITKTPHSSVPITAAHGITHAPTAASSSPIRNIAGAQPTFVSFPHTNPATSSHRRRAGIFPALLRPYQVKISSKIPPSPAMPRRASVPSSLSTRWPVTATTLKTSGMNIDATTAAILPSNRALTVQPAVTDSMTALTLAPSKGSNTAAISITHDKTTLNDASRKHTDGSLHTTSAVSTTSGTSNIKYTSSNYDTDTGGYGNPTSTHMGDTVPSAMYTGTTDQQQDPEVDQPAATRHSTTNTLTDAYAYVVTTQKEDGEPYNPSHTVTVHGNGLIAMGTETIAITTVSSMHGITTVITDATKILQNVQTASSIASTINSSERVTTEKSSENLADIETNPPVKLLTEQNGVKSTHKSIIELITSSSTDNNSTATVSTSTVSTSGPDVTSGVDSGTTAMAFNNGISTANAVETAMTAIREAASPAVSISSSMDIATETSPTAATGQAGTEGGTTEVLMTALGQSSSSKAVSQDSTLGQSLSSTNTRITTTRDFVDIATNSSTQDARPSSNANTVNTPSISSTIESSVIAAIPVQIATTTASMFDPSQARTDSVTMSHHSETVSALGAYHSTALSGHAASVSRAIAESTPESFDTFDESSTVDTVANTAPAMDGHPPDDDSHETTATALDIPNFTFVQSAPTDNTTAPTAAITGEHQTPDENNSHSGRVETTSPQESSGTDVPSGIATDPSEFKENTVSDSLNGVPAITGVSEESKRSNGDVSSETTAITTTPASNDAHPSTTSVAPVSTPSRRKQKLPKVLPDPMTPAERQAASIMHDIGCLWLMSSLASCILLGAFADCRSVDRQLPASEEISLLLCHFLIWRWHDATYSEKLCSAASILIQYFTLVYFTFLFIESTRIFAIVTGCMTHPNQDATGSAQLYGWVLTFLIVVGSAATYFYNYVADYSCWLNLGHSVKYVTMVPVPSLSALTLIFNEAAGSYKVGSTNWPNGSEMDLSYKSSLVARQSIFVILPLSFASWAAGFSAVYYQRFAMYIFVFGINISLGVAFFLFHALQNNEIRGLLQLAYFKTKVKLRRFL